MDMWELEAEEELRDWGGGGERGSGGGAWRRLGRALALASRLGGGGGRSRLATELCRLDGNERRTNSMRADIELRT